MYIIEVQDRYKGPFREHSRMNANTKYHKVRVQAERLVASTTEHPALYPGARIKKIEGGLVTWLDRVDPQEADAREHLRAYLKKHRITTLYTTLRHVSQSGMMRHISVIGIAGNEPRWLSYWVAQALGWKLNKDDGVEVGGVGMDMGFHLIYELSAVLYGDGYKIKQRWL